MGPVRTWRDEFYVVTDCAEVSAGLWHGISLAYRIVPATATAGAFKGLGTCVSAEVAVKCVQSKQDHVVTCTANGELIKV